MGLPEVCRGLVGLSWVYSAGQVVTSECSTFTAGRYSKVDVLDSRKDVLDSRKG